MKIAYAIVFVLGTLLPIVCFTKHFGTGAPDAWAQFWAAPFATWVISGFSWDLMFTATAATLFIVHESRRQNMKGIPIHIGLIFLIGMSCSLPLFLLRREFYLQRSNP